MVDSAIYREIYYFFYIGEIPFNLKKLKLIFSKLCKSPHPHD